MGFNCRPSVWPFTHPVYLVVTSFFLCVWGGLPSQRRHSQWGSCSRVDRFEWVGWGPWLVVTSSTSDYFQSGLYSKLAFVLSVERYFSVVRPFNQLRNRCLNLVLRTKRAVLLSFLCTFLDFHAVKFCLDLLRFCWGFCALRWLWPSPASSSPSSSPSPTTSCSPPSTREASSDLVSVDSQSVSIGLNWSQLVSVSILMQGTPRAFRLSLELDYYTGVCGCISRKI